MLICSDMTLPIIALLHHVDLESAADSLEEEAESEMKLQLPIN